MEHYLGQEIRTTKNEIVCFLKCKKNNTDLTKIAKGIGKN